MNYPYLTLTLTLTLGVNKVKFLIGLRTLHNHLLRGEEGGKREGEGKEGKGREKGGRRGKREGPPCSQPPLLKNPGYGPASPCTNFYDQYMK